MIQHGGDVTHVVYAVPIEDWQYSPVTDWLETSSHGVISDNPFAHKNLGPEHETSLERSEWKIKHFHGFLPTFDQLPRTVEERMALSFCHKLVDMVPREGFIELAEALVEIIDSYRPEREEIPALPPVASPTRAVYGDMVESPPFFFDLDED